MRTYIYIDGFNFYYGAVKNTPYKWLDFKKLFQYLLNPVHQIIRIKYFTAKVSGKFDPDQPIRQKTFIRALKKHIPELKVYYGQFNAHTVHSPLAYPIDARVFGNRIKFAYTIKTEEKGSDVNLAVHALHDAWSNKYDCAIIVSNDSDLAESLKIIKKDLNKKIGLINPGFRYASTALRKHSDFTKVVRKGALKASQLPTVIPGTTIKKPAAW